MLTQSYEVIVFKHCFPVSDIEPDTGTPDVMSSRRSLENYRLQYAALKEKLLSFPNHRFILWTGSALIAAASMRGGAGHGSGVLHWVKEEWMRRETTSYCSTSLSSRRRVAISSRGLLSGRLASNSDFAVRVAPLFVNRL
jgi:hypothetical protein